MSSNIHAAVKRWEVQGIDLLPSAPLAKVREAFVRAGLLVSDELVLLYSLCGGMPRSEVDNNLFSLWPLEVCIQEAVNWPSDELPFADGFLSAHIYFIRSNAQGTMEVYGTDGSGGITPLAISVDEMLKLLMTDPAKLYLPH